MTNPTPQVENKLVNLIKNRDDLKKWLLATSPYGEEIQQNLNAVVGQDEKFNNAIVRHALDLKDESIFRNPNAFNVTFYDMKKFDQVNPVIGKLAAQVRANKLTEKELNQKLLDDFEADQNQARLDKLRYGSKNEDDDNDDNDDGSGGGGGTPTPTEEELQARLNRLRGNTPAARPLTPPSEQELLDRFNRLRGNVPESEQEFIAHRVKQRRKEMRGLEKGARGKVKKTRESIEKLRSPHTSLGTPSIERSIDNLNPSPEDFYWQGVAEEWIPNTVPLSTPPPFKYNEEDFPPLSRTPPVLPSIADPSTSLYSSPLPPIPSDTPQSASTLRNKLPSIDPLPSLPNINDFSRPITEVLDDRNNTIEITPKKAPVPPIGQKQLSKELSKLFPDVDATIKEKDDTFKERTENIQDLLEQVGKNEQSDMTFELEFFQGGENSKFNSFMNRFGLNTENQNFIEFLQSEYCRKILEKNNLKIHIETGNVYYNDRDTNESIFNFIQNQQNIIRHDFKFNGDFKQYFTWILNQFDAHEKTNYDLLDFQNIKFLVYRYNDILLSGGNEIIKIRHTQLTNNYLAAEEIQNQDWQFFIERILEVSHNQNSISPQETFLKSTIGNITVAKKVYKMLFNTVATNFHLTIPQLNSKTQQKISDMFYVKNYSYSSFLTNLDDWISYYYAYGNFPGSYELIIIPYTKNPYFLKTDEHLSPATLH